MTNLANQKEQIILIPGHTDLPPILSGTPCEACASLGHEHTISLLQAVLSATYLYNLLGEPMTYCGQSPDVANVYINQN